MAPQVHIQPSSTQHAHPATKLRSVNRHKHVAAEVIQRDGWMQNNQCPCGHTWWTPLTGPGTVA